MIFLCLLLIGVGAALAAPPQYGCQRRVPTERKMIVYPGSGYCYEFITNKKLTYMDASTECRFYGGSLVAVTSEAIEDFLTSHLRFELQHFHDVWIGLHDRDSSGLNDGVYVWEDGSPLVYQHWGTGKGPDSFQERHAPHDCVAMDNFGRWHDFDCVGRKSHGNVYSGREPGKAFICQFKAVKYGAETTTDDALVQDLKTTQAPEKKPVETSRPMAETTKIPNAELRIDAPNDEIIGTTREAVEHKDVEVPKIETTESPGVETSETVKDEGVKAPTKETRPARRKKGDCPPFVCSTDCGVLGYKSSSGCMLCECNK